MSSDLWSAKQSPPNAHFLNPIPQHLRALVLDYLFQNCHGETAKALLNDTGVRQLDADGDEIMSEPAAPSPDLSFPSEAIRSLELRREIRKSILSGRIEHAMDLINLHFPSVLNASPSPSPSPPPPDTSQFLYARSLEPQHISLNLRIQAFIESVRTSPLPNDAPPPTLSSLTDPDAAKVQLIQSARKLSVLQQALPDAEDKKRYSEELKHVVSLLAYNVPESSPAARYMSLERREAVADQVNSAILHRTGYQSTSSIELSARYTTVLWSFLHDMKVKPPAESSRHAGIRLPPTVDPAAPVIPSKATSDKDSEVVPQFNLEAFLNTRIP